MVVSLSLSSAAAASPKKKLSITPTHVVLAAVALSTADTIFHALGKTHVSKKERLRLAKSLVPIMKGAVYV